MSEERHFYGTYRGVKIYDLDEWLEIVGETAHLETAITAHLNMNMGTATMPNYYDGSVWDGLMPGGFGGRSTFKYNDSCAYCKSPRKNGEITCPQCGAPYR